MKDELSRCDKLKIPYYVLHPGSPLDSGFDAGMERIISGIDEIYSNGEVSAITLLEITAGMGNTIGGRFEHLEAIIESVKHTDKIGICLDTCHMYASGYDIVNDYDKIMDDVEQKFGNKLKIIHLNDSKGALGEHKDRHELIGKGHIGLETFRRLVNDKRLKNVLGILETPVEGYSEEVALLKSLRNS
jgi:deoxyribonuclease-4